MPQSFNPNGVPISAYCLGLSHGNAACRSNEIDPLDDDKVKAAMVRAMIYAQLAMEQERSDKRKELAWKLICLVVGVGVGAGLVTVLNRGI